MILMTDATEILGLHEDGTVKVGRPNEVSGAIEVYGNVSSGYAIHHAYVDARGAQYTINGVYFVRLSGAGDAVTTKLVLLR